MKSTALAATNVTLDDTTQQSADNNLYIAQLRLPEITTQGIDNIDDITSNKKYNHSSNDSSEAMINKNHNRVAMGRTLSSIDEDSTLLDSDTKLNNSLRLSKSTYMYDMNERHFQDGELDGNSLSGKELCDIPSTDDAFAACAEDSDDLKTSSDEMYKHQFKSRSESQPDNLTQQDNFSEATDQICEKYRYERTPFRRSKANETVSWIQSVLFNVSSNFFLH